MISNQIFSVGLATALVPGMLTVMIFGTASASPMRQTGYHKGVAGSIAYSYSDGLTVGNATLYCHEAHIIATL